MSALPSLELEPVPPGPRVVAIGFFDGVHAGHRAVLAEARRVAEAAGGLPVAALTFVEHPRTVLKPDDPVPLLSTWDEKQALLRAAGADEVIGLHFTPGLAGLDPIAFIGEVLIRHLGMAHGVVGFNFRFGRAAAGTPDLLTRVAAESGLGVTVVPPFMDGEVTVSSTAVRDAVAAGDVALAARLLGRPWSVSGIVVPGDRRGRELGFPTANVAVPDARLLPDTGVYAGWAGWEGEPQAPCVVNLGYRPTFDGRERRFEVHVTDRTVDLYGVAVETRLVARIRGEQRFSGPDALVARIREDVAEARRLLSEVVTS
ncbi:MAG: bifunctional riboflavin kinase/FAD synthetase [Candidatus Sericytochromatia bacterium]|nr:bifunctional riboflavin kinase/FAD synthetase [Candidatus Sericytochromatia bacterium]